MTFNELCEANKTIKTTDIKGKAYAQVNERIRVFRMLYPEGFITTELVQIGDGEVTFKASVGIGDIVLATGFAHEYESSSYINKTSYIENCETSAIGRALGMLGIGIDTSVASAEEVTNAINNQEELKKQETLEEYITQARINTVKAMCKKDDIPEEYILKLCKIDAIAHMKEKQFLNICVENWDKVKSGWKAELQNTTESKIE